MRCNSGYRQTIFFRVEYAVTITDFTILGSKGYRYISGQADLSAIYSARGGYSYRLIRR